MNEFDNELLHYAKGQTKKNAKYKSRKMVNGRWVYDYGKEGYTSTVGAGKEIHTTEDSMSIGAPKADHVYRRKNDHTSIDSIRTPKSLEEAKAMTSKREKSYHTTKEEVKAVNKPRILKKIRSSKYVSKGKALIKKYIVGEPGKVYPVNSAKEKTEYETIRRKNMSKGRKFIEDYIIGHEGKVTTY